MENGAFAQEQMLHFHNIFKYVVFQRRYNGVPYYNKFNILVYKIIPIGFQQKISI